MAGGKEIRTKIKSVRNTQKITRAMEMVATSKMRKAQERMKSARPYGQKIRSVDCSQSFWRGTCRSWWISCGQQPTMPETRSGAGKWITTNPDRTVHQKQNPGKFRPAPPEAGNP